jgi:hypothetical protein
MSDYLPNKDADLMVFGNAFASKVTAAPATYGLVANDATAISAAAADFAAKYATAADEATRTAAAIVAKDAARLTLIAILRAYAMMIKPNRAVSDEAKTDLGIGIYDFNRAPVAAPETRPQINIVAVDLLRHKLLITDSTTPNKKGKPAGAIGLQFFCQVGDTPGGVAGAPPSDPQSCRFQAFLSKAAMTMEFSAADAGKKAWYFARWQTGTGKVGPFSQVASMTVAG